MSADFLEQVSTHKNKVSCSAVATVAGVSQATVSRVLHSDPSVTPETTARVRKVIEEMGYLPRPSLTHWSKNVGLKTHNIAFLARGESLRALERAPIMLDVLRGVESTLQDHGLCMLQGAVAENRDMPPMIRNKQVDGAIIWPDLQGMSSALIEALRPLPLVYLMGGQETRLPGDRIQPNNKAIGTLAADYLVSRGHKHVAYLVIPDFVRRLGERWQAFSYFAEQKGATVSQILLNTKDLELTDVDNEEVSRSIGQDLRTAMEQEPHPTGLFISADGLTAHAYPHLKKMGFQIGSDIEIISCNSESAFLIGLDPKPKSISLQGELIGRRAVEQLLLNIQHGQAKDTFYTVEIDPQLH